MSAPATTWRRELAWLGAFLGAAALLRSSTFFQSQVGTDEALYLTIARGLLHGQLPYVDLIDNKPPGIYLLFALAQVVLGQNVLAMRLLACLFNALSCLLLLRIGRTMRSEAVGAIAALLYLFFSLGNYGLEANTELFYTPFVLAGFLALVYRPLADGSAPTPASCFWGGLSLGCALEIKYVVVFDTLAVALLLWAQTRRHAPGLPALARRAGPFCAGFLLPFALFLGFYAAVGHRSEFLDYNLRANLTHRTDTAFAPLYLMGRLKDQVRENLLLWVGTVCAGGLALARRAGTDAHERSGLRATLLWFACAILGVSFTKTFYRHYFAQLLPAQCLLTALVIGVATRELRAFERGLALVLVLVVPLTDVAYRPLADGAKLAYFHVLKRQPTWHDTPAEIAAYLRPRVPAGRTIYVADYKAIINYLVPAAPLPSRYMLPEFLNDPHFAKVARVDALAELDAIMEKRPLFVVRRREGRNEFYQRLDRYLRADYVLDRAFEESNSADWQLSEEPAQDRYIELYRRLHD